MNGGPGEVRIGDRTYRVKSWSLKMGPIEPTSGPMFFERWNGRAWIPVLQRECGTGHIIRKIEDRGKEYRITSTYTNEAGIWTLKVEPFPISLN